MKDIGSYKMKENLKLKKDFGGAITVLCLILFVGSGSSVFQSYHPINNTLGFVIYLLCGLYLFIKSDFYSSKTFLISLLIVGMWSCYHYYTDISFQYISYGLFILDLVFAYLLVRRLRYDIFYYFEKIVYFLAIVSLVFWMLNNLLGTETLVDLAPLKASLYYRLHEASASFVFYTVGVFDPNVDFQVGNIIKNCGFCWEPGRFSSVLVFSFAIYLIRVKNSLGIFSKRGLVYVLTIITTFSTTGYIALLFLLILNLLFKYNSNWNLKFILLGCLIWFVPVVYQLDFIGKKIEMKMDESDFHTNKNMKWMAKSDRVFCVDRFEGLVLDGFNLSESPYLGYGLADKDSYVYKEISPYIVTSNGIIKPLAQWGCVLGLAFMFLYARSTRYYCKLMQYKPVFMLVVITLLISVSYNFFNSTLFFAFAFCSLFTSKKDNLVNTSLVEQ